MPNNAIPMTVMDNSTAVQLQATEGISVDVSGKADKVTGATSGNFAGLDAHGNLTDSGKKASDFLTAHQDISGKANLGVIAPAYADLTFPVTAGQGCIKDGVRYTAKHDIQTSESWTAAHWEAASVEDSIQGVKSEITSKMDEPESEGTSGQVLTTDGNGGRTWTTVQGGSVDPSAIAGAVDDWCDENITNPSNPPLDRSLLSSSSAAPADLLGDLKDTAAVKVTSPDKTNHSNLGEWNHPVSIKAYGNYSFGNAYIANDSSLCDLDDLTLTQGTVGVSIKPLSNGAFILNGQATGVTIGTAVYIPSDSHRLQVVGEKLVARVYTTKKIRLLIRDKHTSGRTELKDTTISTLNSLVTVTITTAITANPAGIDIAFCTTSGTEFSNDLVWVGLYHEGTTITDLGSVPPVTVNDNTNQNMNTLLYPSSVQYIMETKKYADNKFTYITPEAFYGEAIPEYIDAQTYISQAISYAVANNLMVYCGGSYKISTPITITDNNVAIKINKLIYDGNNYAIRLTGKHCRVEIRYLESSADGFQFAGTSDSSVDASHNNLVIDYAKCVGDVIRFISINDEQLVAGKNSYNYIHITRAWSTTGSIINLEFNSGSGENRIYGCYVRTDSNYAIKSSRASQYFYNFKFEADAYSGIYLESPTGTILQNNKFIDCRTIECEDAVLQDNTHTRKFCKIVGTWNYVSFAVTD